MSLVLRRALGVMGIAAGLSLLCAALWVFLEAVWPRWKVSAWSIHGTSMILNHEWLGNEIYLLILLYLGVGSGLVTAGLLGWRWPAR